MTITPPIAAIRTNIMRTLAEQAATGRPLYRREERAIAIAGSLTLRETPKSWYVDSQSTGQEYRIRHDSCTCPDDKGRCKHLLAVELLMRYVETLSQRLNVGQSWDDAKRQFPGETHETVETIEHAYVDLMASALGYEPPQDSLLHSFRLEAIGDDAVAAEMMSRRAGRVFTPLKVSHLHLERPWVARIRGLCPIYEFVRDFARGHKEYREANKRGSRGVWVYYELPPGLYEVKELLARGCSRRYFARVADLEMVEIEKGELLEWLTGKRS